jgi:hypothetical protein
VFKLSTKLTKFQKDLEEERQMNKCLTSNQEIYQQKLVSLEERFIKVEQEKNKVRKHMVEQIDFI